MGTNYIKTTKGWVGMGVQLNDGVQVRPSMCESLSSFSCTKKKKEKWEGHKDEQETEWAKKKGKAGERKRGKEGWRKEG